jgi:hypothetical protein
MLPIEQQHEDLDWNLTNHAPGEVNLSKIEALRTKAKEFGHMIIGNTPPSREQSLALTHLEQAVMDAVASLARQKDQA